MSQRRPPDEHDPEQADGDRTAGLRSQTRPAQKQEWGMTKPLDSEGMGARPTPLRPEPGRAFKAEGSESPVKVARAVYAGTPPASEAEPTRAPVPPPAAPQRAAQASVDRTHLLGSAGEPLRVPSNRPAPPPAANNRPSAKATLMMNDANRPPEATASAPKAPPPGRAQPPSGVSADRHPGGTLSVREQDIRANGASAGSRAKPPESNAPRRGPGSTAPVPQVTGESEPLRLQLDAGDMIEQPVEVAPPSAGSGRSSTLVIVLAVLAIIAGGAGVWYGMSGSAAPAADAPPTRNDMQPAETAPTPAPGSQPTAVPPAQNPATAPSAAAPQAPPAAQPTAAPPAAAAPAGQAPAQDEADDSAAAAPSTPAAKPEPAARRKPRGGKARAPSGPVSPDVAAARDALRDLEQGGPVLRVEPSEEIPAPDQGPSDSPPPPPEPPPPDPE